jgi:spore coat protein H
VRVSDRAATMCSVATGNSLPAGSLAVAIMAIGGCSTAPPPLFSSGAEPDAAQTSAADDTARPAAIDAGRTGPSSSDSGAHRPVQEAPPTLAIDESMFVFDDSQLRTYNLIVDEADLAMIDANPSAEIYVPARLELEGRSHGPIRMRYKGNAGAWDPPCTAGGVSLPSPKSGKCSIKIDFDLDFFGLKKLNFHAMNHDPSLLRERLAYGLFREMKVAASRVVHARLLINGKLEGLFAVVEQVDRPFLRRHFTDDSEGNLYKEVWPAHIESSAYVAALETNTKRADVQRMLAFKSAVDTGPDAFSQFVDLDYTMRYIAVDRVIVNDDGPFHFWCRAIGQGNNPGLFGNHNYYWYEAELRDRMWLIPWDLDFALGARSDVRVIPEWTKDAPCLCGYPSYGIQMPASCDPLVRNLRQWIHDYDAKVDELIAGPFQADRVNSKLDAWAAQIQETVTEASGVNGAPAATEWARSIQMLKAEIDRERQQKGRLTF